MKKLMLLFSAIFFICLSTQAQRKIEISPGFNYGVFSDQDSKDVYKNISSFELSVTAPTKLEWLDLGLYVKLGSSSDGIPHLPEVQGVNASAESSLSFFSIGSEFDIVLSKNLKFYTRIGFFNFTEEVSVVATSGSDSASGSKKEKFKGNNIDFGAKVYFPLCKEFKVFLKGEYSIVVMKEDLFSNMNNLSIGAGITITF